MVPSSALGLHLHDKEFRSCLCYWLGVLLHSSPFPCTECGATADIFVDHQLGCEGNVDRIFHHNLVRDVIYNAVQSAALAPIREAPSLVPNSSSRPAYILLPTWSRGCPAALDVHIISPLQQQTISGAASTPSHVLEVGTQWKLTSHLSDCREAGVEFFYLVVETLGGPAKNSIHIICSIGKMLGQHLNSSDPATSISHLFGRLSISLWQKDGRCRK